METEPQKQTTPAFTSGPHRAHPASDTGTPEQTEASCKGGGAASPDSGEDSSPPLGLLLRNLSGGVRISLSLRVDEGWFCATPAALALLSVTDLAVNLLVSFLLVGREGSFAYSAVPSFFFHLPLLLFFGYLAGRVLCRPSLALLIPVALVALSFPVELLHALFERMSQLRQLTWLADYLVAPHYYRFFWWWSAASLLFLLRLARAATRRSRITVLLLFLVLVVPPLWVFPRGDLWVSSVQTGESGELHLTEEVLAAQAQLLDEKAGALVPGQKGVVELYFVGLAGDAMQDVFLKEVTAAEQLFARRFRAAGHTLVLANNPKTAATLPFATATNLERAVSRVAEVMNPDEDVLLLFLTSHGSEDHELVVNNPPLELEGITPEKVAGILKGSGVTWKVIVVSACYAGGFIEPLKDDKSLIITAADATRESFGCGFGERLTWFGEAFLDHALRNTYSFTAAFESAREVIRKWEEEQGETPSNPQIWVGKGIEQKLGALEEQLGKR